MASITASSLSVPSFSGLRASPLPSSSSSSSSSFPLPPLRSLSPIASASLKDSLPKSVGNALLAFTAGALLASSVGSASAADVIMGGDDGSLAFIPSKIVVSVGEPITFKNNAGFPHNVVFDEDEIPEGVDYKSISMDEETLLNAKNDVFTTKLPKPGVYKFYCSPHQGSGMVGTVEAK